MYLASLDDDAPAEKPDPGKLAEKITLPQDNIMQSWSKKISPPTDRVGRAGHCQFFRHHRAPALDRPTLISGTSTTVRRCLP